MKIPKYIGDAIDDFNRVPLHHRYGDLGIVAHDGITPVKEDFRVTELVIWHSFMIYFMA
ncbi:MAG TPA: hypothetical protein VFD46_12545 [Chryseolinea sp.]|nr:hypothetical protein [Chryseolinea sp.]